MTGKCSSTNARSGSSGAQCPIWLQRPLPDRVHILPWIGLCRSPKHLPGSSESLLCLEFSPVNPLALCTSPPSHPFDNQLPLILQVYAKVLLLLGRFPPTPRELLWHPTLTLTYCITSFIIVASLSVPAHQPHPPVRTVSYSPFSPWCPQYLAHNRCSANNG